MRAESTSIAERNSGVEGAVVDKREAPPPPLRVSLGAELPVFCERCGYSLHALPQVRCEHCDLLQFHCPECGHHQPINTLRPAVQRTLGRVRAFTVGAIAFFKLNWFGWHLFFWVIMGMEWAYTWNWRSQTQLAIQPNLESVLAFSIYACVIGLFSRMMLLRWRRSIVVGVVLGLLYGGALLLGFHWRVSGTMFGSHQRDEQLQSGHWYMTGLTVLVIFLATLCAWPMWVGFVRVAMPRRAGEALLEWQRSLSSGEPAARKADLP